MKSFNVPLLLVGGGGYTIRNVSRCWLYETAIALNQEVSDGMEISIFPPEICEKTAYFRQKILKIRISR